MRTEVCQLCAASAAAAKGGDGDAAMALVAAGASASTVIALAARDARSTHIPDTAAPHNTGPVTRGVRAPSARRHTRDTRAHTVTARTRTHRGPHRHRATSSHSHAVTLMLMQPSSHSPMRVRACAPLRQNEDPAKSTNSKIAFDKRPCNSYGREQKSRQVSTRRLAVSVFAQAFSSSARAVDGFELPRSHL